MTEGGSRLSVNKEPNPLCIVAGAGPGIGASVAKKFGELGFSVALIARRQAEMDQIARRLPHRSLGYVADLCDLASLERAFTAIGKDFGAPSVLVYNAARWHESPAMSLDVMTFNWDLALCASGALACAQQVYPPMKAAQAGTILFTGGGLALYPEYGAGVSSLTAGKSALRGLCFALAKELAPDGIHVATVTVAGAVQAGTAFDPDLIAEEYATLHLQAAGSWEVERVFRGKS